jgi:hypothetical protein
MHYKVLNGNRILEFDGELLASSTSRRPNAHRWVEFNLYITAGGEYVLERIGQTQIFHGVDCEVVERNKLTFDPEHQELSASHVACEECNPWDDDSVIIEKPRYYGMNSKSPDAILNALHKKDKDNTKYMTYVTQRLVEDAALKDKRIANAYRVEYIA